jgi:Flavin containing amine oxidoreductase
VSPASGDDGRRVVVVGGGLAGMVAALRLGQQGVGVDLYEATDRLGGKAGSEQRSHGWSDHGYHVFPAWYHNLWALVDELGIRDRFVPRKKFFRLPRNGTPKHAVMWPRTILSAIDLVSRRQRYLEELSLSGFLRSRWYNGLETGRELRDISLKGLGNPAWDVSSLTTRQNMRLWLKVLWKPNWTAVDGSLQERFIAPIERALDDVGVSVHRNAPLRRIDVEGRGDGLTITALHVEHGEPVDTRDRPVVLAIPHGRLHPLLLPHLTDLPTAVQDIGYLRSQPMVAFDVHLTCPVDGLPRDGHVILDGSRFHLTLLDIRDLWGSRLPGHHTHPVLQLVAADTRSIDGTSADDLEAALVADLRSFLPSLGDEDIGGVVLHDNKDVPLFMNDVGTDRRRPLSTRAYGTNLHLAGDWCHTPVDLACMEGALVSGSQVAHSILAIRGKAAAPELKLPSEQASAGAWALRFVLAPILWLFGQPVDLYRWLRRRSG